MTLQKLGLTTPAVGAGGPGYASLINAALALVDKNLPDYVSRVDPASSDISGVFNADYDAIEAAGGGPLFVHPGDYFFASDLLIDSNLVSVVCAGSGVVNFHAVGTAKVVIKPAGFTVAKGPTISGFTVTGDPAAPSGAILIEFGDITQCRLDDIVWQGATGTNSIGVLCDTAQQTELVSLGSLRGSNCTAIIKFTNSNPAFNSLARWSIEKLELDVKAGQTGWMMRNQVNMYGANMNIVGNMDGPGVFFDFGYGTTDACGINGGHWMVNCEQTSGSGGIPYKVGLNAFAFAHVGSAEFFGAGLAAPVVTGGPRHEPAFRPHGLAAIIEGFDDPIEGQIANFLGSGNPATLHPLLWDNKQDPFAMIGFLTGSNIRAPFVAMYDSAESAFIVYAIGSGAPNNLVEVWRITNQGHVVVSRGTPPTPTNGPALGTSPPAATTSGNNMKGTVSLGTGTSPTTLQAVRVTFATPWPVLPEVVIQPLTGVCQDVKPYVVRNVAYFDIFFGVAPAASQPAGTYAWSYHASG